MNFGIFAKRAGQLVADNSPAMLTALGVTGALTTALLTAKATFKAADVLREEMENKTSDQLASNEPIEALTTQEKTKAVWKLYVPAAGTAALTVAAIVGANHINTRRAAALASAYSIMQKAGDEYKAKVLDKIGEKKEAEVRQELAQDRVKASDSKLIIIEGKDAICFDQHSGRRFQGSTEGLKKAQNDLNHMLIKNTYASLSDFYDKLGIPRTSDSDEIGWNVDNLLELEIGAVLDDGEPCISFDYRVMPVRNYTSAY